MTDPVRIWLEISHHGAFRVGGWAWVRAEGAMVTGQAGGDRRVEADAVALSGLVAALASPRAAPVELHTSSALIAAIPGRVAAARAGGEAPGEDLALWVQAGAALAAGPVRIIRAAPVSGGPPAFADAWAEQARDRAKAKGAFAAPIPRSNLARSGAVEAVAAATR